MRVDIFISGMVCWSLLGCRASDDVADSLGESESQSSTGGDGDGDGEPGDGDGDGDGDGEPGDGDGDGDGEPGDGDGDGDGDGEPGDGDGDGDGDDCVQECELPAWPPVPPQFVVGQETVQDATTGLEWQRTPPVTALGFAAAQAYCSALDLDGHGDWRMPNRAELISIHDFTVQAPAQDAAVFELIPADQYGAYLWTRSVDVSEPNRVYTVGQKYGYPGTASTEIDEQPVRCVREVVAMRVPVPRFVATPFTVEDQVSGLVWERAPDAAMVIGSQAAATCSARQTGGFDDWRVPSLHELLSITNIAYYDPALDSDFSPAFDERFWSDTLPPNTLPDHGFVVNFTTGQWSVAAVVINPFKVRCVRDG